MNKKIKLFVTAGLILSSVSLLSVKSNKTGIKAVEGELYYVDFFNNYLREEFTLSSGFTGRGNNVIYKTVQVTKDSLVDKPEDPTRRNYEFQGWYKEEACLEAWNFDTDKVIKNTRIFAKWGISSKEEMVEPEYTPPSTVLEESAETEYVLNSVMNFVPNDLDQVKLPTAALEKLEANKNDVLPLMEYKVKASKSITATYNNNKITITCGDEERVLQVKDDSENLTLSTSSYETKAKNYEKKALEEESYHVMLAGSSSIEFWESSKEDLAPIVSYNHGIGGTTIEEWDEKLNARLVLPYKPKMVVYYVGINNVINSKQDKDTIWTNLKKFLDDTHESLPDTKVQYILMNLIPNYTSYFDTINAVNDQVIEYQKSNESWLTLINPGLALVKENGVPNAAYFRTDGLHLSYYGYVVWGEIVKESILNGLENM
ncbi:MAG: InlB B-repeat-containing protein [Bacilli bacterium]|nr:InlB B-repeat-containing protein [Bacilli bacterium]